MNERLLEFFLTYGLVALFPILLFGAIGVPFPGSLLLLAAGAFAGAGELNLAGVLLCAIVSTIMGNIVGYWLGLRGGEAALTRWGQRFRISAATIAQGAHFFARWGSIAVVFSRFPLSPLSAIINIIAGTAHYSLRLFILYNIAGVSVWAAVYVGLGYIFGANWEMLVEVLNGATQALTLAVLAALLLAFIIRTLRNRHDHERPASADETPLPPAEAQSASFGGGE